MNLTLISKRITLILAYSWLLGTGFFSAVLLGTLAHELMHKQTAREINAISIDYAGGGLTIAKEMNGDHDWIYFSGYVVEATLFTLSVMSLLFIVMYNEKAVIE